MDYPIKGTEQYENLIILHLLRFAFNLALIAGKKAGTFLSALLHFRLRFLIIISYYE